MRRLPGAIVLLALCVVTAGFVSAQTITVTKPTDFPSEPYCMGKTYPITWTTTGSLPNQVRITLRNATSTAEVALIADPAPNNGTYMWTLPTNLADGKYVVRVKAKGAAVYGDSQASTMVTCPSLKITNPHQGDFWDQGTSHNITWDLVGNIQNGSKIVLLDALGKLARPIADHMGNLGGYTWPVPGNLALGNYTLQISATAIVLGQNVTVMDAKTVKIVPPKINKVLVPIKK
jgi:hypothetical protein